MLKYAKIDDPKKGTCMVGIGTDAEFYESIGMTLMDVEESDDGTWYLAGFVPPPVITPEDYDRAMEDHITEARMARGYTTREPTEYLGSAVPRWAQDAVDYIAFRDACMLYGLDIQNKYAAGEPVPTLDEFKASLPQIVWTYTGTEE